MTGASGVRPRCPAVLGLFQKRIDGDDSLLRLAELRFKEAGLGAEFYAESPPELGRLLKFRPSPGTPAVVHLSRGLNVFEEAGRRVVVEFAQGFHGRVYGIVMHDQPAIAERFSEYLVVLRYLESELDKIEGCPLVFIEYASGLDPELFIKLFREIRGFKHVSACIDIGHIGLRQAGKTFARYRPGEDIFSLKTDTRHLTEAVDALELAVPSGREAVINMVRELGGLGKPLHFHLHDAHPLSRGSPFGISDHLSFLDKVPVPFEYKGESCLDPMFGPVGLSEVVREALRLLGPERLSFTLEIHPTKGRLSLGDVSCLFSHWKERENAERMNFWMSVLKENQKLVLKACGREETVMEKRKGMIIYNLFPLLAGRFNEWERHLARAADMGFTWIFVNPVQLPGASGSIYSIKDYFSFNPLLIDAESGVSPREQLRDAIRTAEKFGLRVMVDLVINHCAADSELTKAHPEWFLREPGGGIAHPFADENGKKVVWKDLAKFDHRNTRDREGLFLFFLEVVKFLAETGFKGFRCDAAYQVPKSLWERLIKEARKVYPDLLFFAETLGTTPDSTRRTAGAGFDYIFNSSKWWDFESQWLMQQYNLTREIAPSVSFPESHDTLRLCEELNGNTNGLKQRYLFSAVFSAGVMMPMGFEFGFRKKLHVVKTRPEDWEETGIDLTPFIAAVNKLKSEHAVFQEDSPAAMMGDRNPRVLLMWKASTRTQEESLLILNKDIQDRQSVHEENLQKYLQARAPLADISPEYPLDFIPSPFSYELRPGQGIVLTTSRDEVPED